MPNNEIEFIVEGGQNQNLQFSASGGNSGEVEMEAGNNVGSDGPFARCAEAWAVGTKGGVTVPPSDDPTKPTSENNSKYYSQLSQQYAGRSAGFAIATGEITSFPKIISDSRIDASCVVENEYVFSDMDLGWVTTAGQLILYGSLRTNETKPSVQLWLRKIEGLLPDPFAITLSLQTSNSENGNYLVARARNLLPGVQYSYRLYKVVDGGTDVYVYGVGAVTGWPTYNYWFQEVPRGLEDGEEYYVTLTKSTEPSTILATSAPVEFEGGANVPTVEPEEEEEEEEETEPEEEEEPEET